MPEFRFRLRAHGSELAAMTVTLNDLCEAETCGRGILANLEAAGLRDGDYLVVENERGEMVLNLMFPSLTTKWPGTDAV